jgi:hypothetical protein
VGSWVRPECRTRRRTSWEGACVTIMESDAVQRVVKNTLQPADYSADSAGFARNLEKDVAEKTRLVPMPNLN